MEAGDTKGLHERQLTGAFMVDTPPSARLAHPGVPPALQSRENLGLFHKRLSPLSLIGSDHPIWLCRQMISASPKASVLG